MRTVNEIQNDIMLEELKECIDRCKVTSSLFSIKQVLQTNSGDINIVSINEAYVETDNYIYINENRYYLRLNIKDNILMKKVKSFWEIYLERGTAKTFQNEPNDYIFTIDLIKAVEVEGCAFAMSFMNPMFMSIEDNGLVFVFDINNMHFGKDEIDFIDVSQQVEYAEEEERFAEEQERKKEEAYDETDYVLSNDDYIM